MIEIPDRISDLMQRIESGGTITREDLNRVAVLQAFDVAQVGRQFVNDAVEREKQWTQELRKQMELPTL